MYSLVPVNKTASVIVNQSGCEDRIESSIAEVNKEGMIIRNRIKELADKIGLKKPTRTQLGRWRKENPGKFQEESRQLGLLFMFYKISKRHARELERLSK